MRTSKISLQKALKAIASRRWVDRTPIDNIRYVWPDEGVWIIAEQMALGDNWIDDTDVLHGEYIGHDPIYFRGDNGARWPLLELVNRHGELCRYTTLERLVRLPENSIILERFFDEFGNFRQQVTISCRDNNPQPRFDFDQPAQMYQLFPHKIAA